MKKVNVDLNKKINEFIDEKKLNYILATVMSDLTKESPEKCLEVVNNMIEKNIHDIEKKMSIISSNIDKN